MGVVGPLMRSRKKDLGGDGNDEKREPRVVARAKRTKMDETRPTMRDQKGCHPI